MPPGTWIELEYDNSSGKWIKSGESADLTIKPSADMPSRM